MIPSPVSQRPMEPLKVIVDQHASADAKIALFRSLFRGREDVYPRRFESRKSGKSGYAPACGNEWVRGVAKNRASNALRARTASSFHSMSA